MYVCMYARMHKMRGNSKLEILRQRNLLPQADETMFLTVFLLLIPFSIHTQSQDNTVSPFEGSSV